MKYSLYQTVVSVALLLFIGCSSSPLSRYPDFTERKEKTTSVILLDDVIILEALRGDTSTIDLQQNKKIAKTCLNYLSGNLSAKGYNVDRVLTTSIGMIGNKSRLNRVMTVPEERDADPAMLRLSKPPYFLHTLFLGDSLKEQLLYGVYSSLVGFSKEKGERNRVLPSAAVLGKLAGGGLMGILLVTGYDLPVTLREHKAEVSRTDSFAKISAEAITQFNMFFYLIDSETGEVVWDQHVERKGGTINENKMFEMLDSILKELP
jgi:hypothetical protein